jgi:hypothetical protein
MPQFSVRRQEDHPHSVLPWFGQLESQPLTGTPEKIMRHLHQDAGAIARILLTPTGTAMVQVLQDRKRLLDDLVRLLPLDVDDEADAARIMFESRVIEALFDGDTRSCHMFALLTATIFTR